MPKTDILPRPVHKQVQKQVQTQVQSQGRHFSVEQGERHETPASAIETASAIPSVETHTPTVETAMPTVQRQSTPVTDRQFRDRQ